MIHKEIKNSIYLLPNQSNQSISAVISNCSNNNTLLTMLSEDVSINSNLW